ncbi:MAG: outer membrane protein assembly factor BamA [Bacteroidales bacterium]|jgi:outer membrane protein insertion porin family|nr:outer membrane protein assembly factor BamA [Bacteroidales bacterium]
MMKMKSMRIISLFALLLTGLFATAQTDDKYVNYLYPDEYTIAGITISGVKFLEPNALIGISGLRIGQKVEIPGEVITAAVRKLWDQGLFSDVKITITGKEGENVWLDIYLQERPRLSSLRFEGIRKSEETDLIEKLSLPGGSQVTAHLLNRAERTIKDHYIEKGFLNVGVDVIQKDDPDMPNNVILNFIISKNEKVKIEEIQFEGNDFFETKRLRRVMKNTKQKDLNIFKGSKFIEDKFEEDRNSLLEFYNENGFRDFRILGDSTYALEDGKMVLVVKINEGNQYYLRNVDWVGNSIYTKDYLTRVFNFPSGEIYNQTMIDKRLNVDDDAVSSLYLNYGYLFSRLTPVEKKVEGDSIDLEVRIFEGDPATLNNVIITGNTRTNEHVARRELFTMPGDLFSKDNLIRSARQVAVLGHFDPEKINPQPLLNQVDGTVDLLYALEEKANDQFEISGGWGAGMLVGTVGVRFNNFAMRNFFKWSEWRPYPSGDGQSLQIRAQSNGRVYQSYNISFIEPWLGGKKPNTLSISAFRSLMTNGSKKGEDDRQSMIIDGASVGFGKRLEWPDNYFSVYYEASYQRYSLNKYSYYQFLFTNGDANLASLSARLTRFSAGPNTIFPRTGSTFSLSLQATPPYSAISGKNMAGIPDEEKYKWIEFYKAVFKADYYLPLDNQQKLILNARAAFGYLGFYNKDIGPSPFENFYVGGDGMTGYSFYGREVIALRGYTNGSLTPRIEKTENGSARRVESGNVYSKLTLELRYPISLNPQATIYGLAFLEAGRAWYDIKDYNPFRMNRSAGIGLRANLPMFGLLGIDWGYGFDSPVYGSSEDSGSQFHFVIGQQF